MTLLSGEWPTDWILLLVHWRTNWLSRNWLSFLPNDCLYWQSKNWPTDWTIWLIDSISDSTGPGLTKSHNDLHLFTIVWLVDWPISWLYCPGTDQLTEWFMAGLLVDNWLYCLKTDQHTEWWNLVDWLNKWLHCPRTDHRTKWFMDGWLTDYLTLMSGNLPTDWMVYCWLIDWIPDCTVQGLTNWLNDLLLIHYLTS